MLDLISAVVSLANLALQTCKSAKEQRTECLRIGERLMNLMVLSHEWMVMLKSQNGHDKPTSSRISDEASPLPSRVVFQSLEQVLIRLNLTLQAATVKRSQWTVRVVQFMQSRQVVDELQQAEQELNAVLQDVQFAQGNVLFAQSSQHFDAVQQRFDRIEGLLMQVVKSQKQQQQKKAVSTRQILEYLAAQKILTDDGDDTQQKTVQERIDQVLQEYQNNAPLITTGVSDILESNKSRLSSASTTTASSTDFSSNQWSTSSSMHSSIGDFSPDADNDVESNEHLMLDMSALQCDFGYDTMLGEGGFSQVFSGVYRGVSVAVKRLKVHEVDIVKMTTREKNRHLRRIHAEAAVMSECCIHPHITQFMGYHAVLTKQERPLMVMELMETSLFMALHEGKLPSLHHRRELMKGVASAMEFLHLRGIVHRDIKSLNILLCGKGLKTAKLADFGEAKDKGFATTHAMTMSLSTGVGSGKGGGVSGTLAYQAPEVLLNKVSQVSRKAEIHTYGIVVWECLTGEIPHQGLGPMQLLLLAQDKQKGTLLDLPDPIPGFRDPDWHTLRNVAKACMTRDAKYRPSASQVAAAMEEGPSYVFAARPAASNSLPSLPAALEEDIPVAPIKTGPSVTLTIERRDKEQGRDIAWDIVCKGRVLTRLESGNSANVQGLQLGGQVFVQVRKVCYVVTIQRFLTPTGGVLKIALKHKTKIKTGFARIEDSASIEVSNTGNAHVQSGYLAWSPSNTMFEFKQPQVKPAIQRVVLPASAPSSTIMTSQRSTVSAPSSVEATRPSAPPNLILQAAPPLPAKPASVPHVLHTAPQVSANSSASKLQRNSVTANDSDDDTADGYDC